MSRSWTTRAQRPGEPDDAYTFVDEATFLQRTEAGGFLEWTYFEPSRSYYGTPRLGPDDGEGEQVLEIEVHGAEQVRDADPEALVVLLVPPSKGDLEARLRARGDEEAHIQRRLHAADDEVARAKALGAVEVVNDDVERAAQAIAGMLRRHREQQ